MDTPSVKPYINKANTESQNISETPNKIIDSPKENIATRSFLPAFLVSGICAEATIIKTEPTAGAALKIPKPSEPTSRISCA